VVAAGWCPAIVADAVTLAALRVAMSVLMARLGWRTEGAFGVVVVVRSTDAAVRTRIDVSRLASAPASSVACTMSRTGLCIGAGTAQRIVDVTGRTLVTDQAIESRETVAGAIHIAFSMSRAGRL
jgi:hypothetical protein